MVKARESGVRFGVVGDIHGFFEDEDVLQLSREQYDRILFVGDLSAYTHRSGLEVARRIAPLADRALVLLGNHDGVSFRHVLAEAKEKRVTAFALGLRMPARVAALKRALGATPLCGYSLHEFRTPRLALSLIAARPHSMGGSRIGYARYLAKAYGVASLEDSAHRLRRLVDEADASDLVFLAHNGPTGLGGERGDIFGCDFLPNARDFGDPDLREAIDYAVGRGRRVRAVFAGHMHHRLQGGGSRVTSILQDETLYVNAARVPRIEQTPAGRRHHHIAVSLNADRVCATPRWLEAQKGPDEILP